MYFKQISKNRYRVQHSKDNDVVLGMIDKQEYDSINITTGARTKQRFWRAWDVSGGWRHSSSRRRFATREEAGKFLIKESRRAYADRDTQWIKRQGEAAALKALKADI